MTEALEKELRAAAGEYPRDTPVWPACLFHRAADALAAARIEIARQRIWVRNVQPEATEPR